MQNNVRCFKNNKYALAIEAAHNNVDILLLNEISTPPNEYIKLRGFTTVLKAIGPNRGTAILVKTIIEFQEIPAKDPNTIAIKINTNLGPLIISTSYIAPSVNTIPVITLNKILNHNIPTVFISDFNAHHPFLNNTTGQGDMRGRQLYSLAQSRNLSFLGPSFPTYITHARQSTPDIILCNNPFKIFHYLITPGNPIGSDHIPIIFKIQIKPFVQLQSANHNYAKMSISNYKEQLESDHFESLIGKDISELESRITQVMENIKKAAQDNSPIYKTAITKAYHPTPRIKLKLKQLQSAYINYYNYGFPRPDKLHQIRAELNQMVTSHKSEQWEKITKIASDHHKNPSLFWKK